MADCDNHDSEFPIVDLVNDSIVSQLEAARQNGLGVSLHLQSVDWLQDRTIAPKSGVNLFQKDDQVVSAPVSGERLDISFFAG